MFDFSDKGWAGMMSQDDVWVGDVSRSVGGEVKGRVALALM